MVKPVNKVFDPHLAPMRQILPWCRVEPRPSVHVPPARDLRPNETMGAESFQQPWLILLREFVLPNPNDLPAAGAQCAGHEPIAGLVGRNFFPPERGVGLRLRAVDRAAVPETAVNEDRDWPRSLEP